MFLVVIFLSLVVVVIWPNIVAYFQDISVVGVDVFTSVRHVMQDRVCGGSEVDLG